MSRMKDTHDSLHAEWTAVATCWRETRRTWRDGAAVRFEAERWQGLEREVLRCLDALRRLDEVLSDADTATR